VLGLGLSQARKHWERSIGDTPSYKLITTIPKYKLVSPAGDDDDDDDYRDGSDTSGEEEVATADRDGSGLVASAAGAAPVVDKAAAAGAAAAAAAAAGGGAAGGGSPVPSWLQRRQRDEDLAGEMKWVTRTQV
jgi:hypothetical protein